MIVRGMEVLAEIDQLLNQSQKAPDGSTPSPPPLETPPSPCPAPLRPPPPPPRYPDSFMRESDDWGGGTPVHHAPGTALGTRARALGPGRVSREGRGGARGLPLGVWSQESGLGGGGGGGGGAEGPVAGYH